LELEILNVLLRHLSHVVDGDDRPPLHVEVRVVQRVRLARRGVGRVQLAHLGPLGQDDVQGKVLDEHVVKDVVDETHVQDVVVALDVEVFVAGHVVADEVVSLPAAKEGEAGAEVELDGVVENAKGGGGDVADVVAVVDVGS
jgi:hypothetical protein